MWMKVATLALAAVCGSAFAVDGTVNVTGTVTTATCTVSVSPSSVALPTVARSALSSVGAVAGITPFQIITTGCTGTGITSMYPYFELGSTTNANGRLSNTVSAGSGGATNVDVQILNSALGVVNLAAAAGSQNVPAVSFGNGAQTFYARYYATGAATAGSYSSSFTFTLIYT